MKNNKENLAAPTQVSAPQADEASTAGAAITAPLKLYTFTEDGMEIDNAFGHLYKKDDVEKLLATTAAHAATKTEVKPARCQCCWAPGGNHAEWCVCRSQP